MTGFDPTAPARDTDQDEETPFTDNVVPPEELTGAKPASNTSDLPAELPDSSGNA